MNVKLHILYLKNLDNGGGRIKSRAISKLLTRCDVTLMVAVVVNRHVTTTAAVDFYVGRTADRPSEWGIGIHQARPTDGQTHINSAHNTTTYIINK